MRRTLTYKSDFISGPPGNVAVHVSYVCGCHCLIFRMGDDANDLNMKLVQINTVYYFAHWLNKERIWCECLVGLKFCVLVLLSFIYNLQHLFYMT